MRGTVVLTASAGGFPGLAERLRESGIAVEERPLMRFAPPADWAPLDGALDAALGGGYGAIAFTSPRAAAAVAERLEERGLGRAVLGRAGLADPGPAVWAAGAGTARALGAVAASVRAPSADEVGRRGAAAALAAALTTAMADAGGARRVLFPCGDHRRDELPARLRAAGIEVDEVVCYRSVLASAREAREAAERAAVLVVASPSVADLLARSCPPDVRPALLAVGPVTAAASRASGWAAAGVAEHPTAEAVSAAARALLI